ncbi:MAG: DUF2721 domain-containing protein [Blastomonas sp.]|nr:DUF2721 domain-containing protein [Blastomonas sp.]
MLPDLLSAGLQLPFNFEIIERTASTPRVQQVVQLSLAPAFLLSGIGAIMNVIMSRMIWIAQRVENIEEKMEEHRSPGKARELTWLMRRRKLMQGAIMFSAAAPGVVSPTPAQQAEPAPPHGEGRELGHSLHCTEGCEDRRWDGGARQAPLSCD